MLKQTDRAMFWWQHHRVRVILFRESNLQTVYLLSLYIKVGLKRLAHYMQSWYYGNSPRLLEKDLEKWVVTYATSSWCLPRTPPFTSLSFAIFLFSTRWSVPNTLGSCRRYCVHMHAQRYERTTSSGTSASGKQLCLSVPTRNSYNSEGTTWILQ